VKRKKSFCSVVVSAMVSDSRVFTVNEFPDWSRLFWLAWLFVPVLFATTQASIETLRADWGAGIGYILMLACGLMLPLGVATG
jgi:hypothetical protein